MAKKGKKPERRVRKKSRPKPTVLSINICDTVVRDEETKKVSLYGLFSVIQAVSFPAVHKVMHVYVALTNGHGKYEIGIQFVNLKDSKALIEMKGDVTFVSPLQVAELNLKWEGIRFKEQGDYEVEILCNGERIGGRKFKVLGPQQVLPPTKETED